MTPPGRRRPFSSASRTIASAARSFTEPPGWGNSALPTISHPVSSDARFRRMRGGLPMAPMKPSRTSMNPTSWRNLVPNPKRRLGPRQDPRRRTSRRGSGGVEHPGEDRIDVPGVNRRIERPFEILAGQEARYVRIGAQLVDEHSAFVAQPLRALLDLVALDRKSTRLNSRH